MLNDYDFKKLLHDIKRLSEGVHLITHEDDHEKRKYIGKLIEDEVERLHSDLEEIRISNGNEKKFKEPK